jgi:hypothetical protein
MEVRNDDTGTHDTEAVRRGDALNGLAEGPASHPLPLEMTRFLASRNRDDLEIVEQNFEVTHFVFAVELQSLKVAKERAECGIFHLNRGLHDGLQHGVLVGLGFVDERPIRIR